MDILVKIKRLVLARKVFFTQKAQNELNNDKLTVDLVYEAILNAPSIRKKIRSSNPNSGQKEYLYIIIGLTYDDTPIYTKGKLIKSEGEEKFLCPHLIKKINFIVMKVKWNVLIVEK